jgi:hypothetical protein
VNRWELKFPKDWDISQSLGNQNSQRLGIFKITASWQFNFGKFSKNNREKPRPRPAYFLQFLNPRILSDGKPDEKREMMGNLKEDDIQKLHTTVPEQLIRNYSSVQFLRQTLAGNALAVGTKSIPGVSSSVTKHTGTGLLQSSVT